MKKLLMSAMIVAASVGTMNAQTSQKQIVEEGGTGPYKSEVVGDASCPAFRCACCLARWHRTDM